MFVIICLLLSFCFLNEISGKKQHAAIYEGSFLSPHEIRVAFELYCHLPIAWPGGFQVHGNVRVLSLDSSVTVRGNFELKFHHQPRTQSVFKFGLLFPRTKCSLPLN